MPIEVGVVIDARSTGPATDKPPSRPPQDQPQPAPPSNGKAQSRPARADDPLPLPSVLTSRLGNSPDATAHGKSETVLLSLLQIDRSYQRVAKLKQQRKMSADWCDDFAGPLIVAQRADYTLWVVDGQQRLGALRIRGVERWRCDVFLSEGPTHEARVFSAVNGGRKPLSGADLFKARLEAKDKLALLAMDAVVDAGYKMDFGRSGTFPYIQCFSAIYQIVKEHGGIDRLSMLLRLTAATWPRDATCLRSVFLRGLAIFIGFAGKKLDVEKFLKKMAGVPVNQILQESRLMASVPIVRAVTVVVANHYNKRLAESNRVQIGKVV